jgi:NADH:ubiquinone oxidoreductase subunit F (NADH-binding)
MTLPRLLAGVDHAPIAYDRHLRVHGDLTAGAHALAATIERSGLRGRGGGGFPLAVKLAAVRRSRGTPILIVNGCEGEPMSAKDRLLLTATPHLVLDGAFALARAIGAAEIIVALDEIDVRTGETVQAALAERPELARKGVVAQIVWVPSGYVSGQETALVRWCNTGVAKPRPATPRVTERGVRRRPTLVCNVETLAHVALIARHGADWFRALGTEDDPGSMLITLSGAVDRPGVYETEPGTRLASLLNAAGGLAEPARAFLIGGYAGGWIDASAIVTAARLTRRDLQNAGARLGAGIVVALPRLACPVAEVARVAGWLADESSGQCGPCVHGLAAVADELDRMCRGSARPDSLDRVARWCELSAGRGACAHPDGTAGFVTSALNVFAAEFLVHAQYGLCDACDRPPVLSAPAGVAAAA